MGFDERVRLDGADHAVRNHLAGMGLWTRPDLTMSNTELILADYGNVGL